VVSDALRSSSMILAVLGMLGVAASAAVSMTGEREQDTWISLATTLLTPAEIVRAKQLGAVWSARWVAVAILVMWAAGLMMLAIHPLGVLAAALYVALVAWLIAAMGVFVSTLAKNSTRALVATFILILIYSAISQWPATLWALLFSYQDTARIRSQSQVVTTGVAAAFGFVMSVSPPVLAGALLTLVSRLRLRATWGQ
jgi:hypothetical protein